MQAEKKEQNKLHGLCYLTETLFLKVTVKIEAKKGWKYLYTKKPEIMMTMSAFQQVEDMSIDRQTFSVGRKFSANDPLQVENHFTVKVVTAQLLLLAISSMGWDISFWVVFLSWLQQCNYIRRNRQDLKFKHCCSWFAEVTKLIHCNTIHFVLWRCCGVVRTDLVSIRDSYLWRKPHQCMKMKKGFIHTGKIIPVKSHDFSRPLVENRIVWLKRDCF